METGLTLPPLSLDLLALLIPIGVLGVFRWTMWLFKRIPALFYRPIVNDHQAAATLVTPVYNEDPTLFRKALESWLANHPDRILAVIDVSDTACLAVAREFPQVEVMPIEEPGKRAALAAGVAATTTELVVLVDSDVIWESDVLCKIKMPFADPRIGGVGTRQHMRPTNHQWPTLWERLTDVILDVRYSDEVPATTLIGQAVSCLSGRTAAYRTELLKELREPFLNEYFLGTRCLSGDDKRYTSLILQNGYRTWNQLNARVYSTFKPDFTGFIQQRIRWSRNSLRSDLRALWQGWVWRYPYLAILLIDKTVAPFMLLLAPVVLALAMVLGNWPLVIALLIWWHVSRAIKLWPHFRRRPADLLILPMFVLTTFMMSLVKAYAMLTLTQHKWLTRSVAMVEGQATRVKQPAETGVAGHH